MYLNDEVGIKESIFEICSLLEKDKQNFLDVDLARNFSMKEGGSRIYFN